MNSSNNRYLIEAKKALRRGDRQTGIWLAGKSILRYPRQVEGWLLLGGLTKPGIRLEYLQKAKFLAPDDPLVDAALRWAAEKSLEEAENEAAFSELGQDQPYLPDEEQQNEPINEKGAKGFKITKRKDQNDHLICPYLGLRRDLTTALGYSSIWNVCHRADPCATPILSHQSTSCLTRTYTNCPVYNAPAGQKLPKNIKHRSIYPFW